MECGVQSAEWPKRGICGPSLPATSQALTSCPPRSIGLRPLFSAGEIIQVTDELFRTMRAMPGNQSYTGGRDSEGKVIAVSIWDTEEHARNLDIGDIRSKLEAQGLKLVPSEFFEIVTPS